MRFEAEELSRLSGKVYKLVPSYQCPHEGGFHHLLDLRPCVRHFCATGTLLSNDIYNNAIMVNTMRAGFHTYLVLDDHYEFSYWLSC